MADLMLVPMLRDEANAFVAKHHRHHGSVVGYRFALGASMGDQVVAVAIVGRPVARHLDDSWTLEVTRLASDGSRNACSFLYAAAWRACRALGYRKLVTYTLASEPGTSLKAAGWRVVGEVRAESWNRKERPRVDTHPLQEKIRWEAANG